MRARPLRARRCSGEQRGQVRDLNIHFRTPEGEVDATDRIGFRVQRGERVGIVGESGCGKTITGLSLLGLLPRETSRVEGKVIFEGRDLLKLSPEEHRKVCGPGIGMIFQEPMSALDPVFTIGEQISETLRAHQPMSRRQARTRTIEALGEVGIPSPRRRYAEYPHSLSGGMRQRVMIAMALVLEPKLLIADEPTTALDVTIQAQIIDLLLSLSERTSTAMLFITHDLGVIADVATRMLTMYAGQIVEDAPIERAFAAPGHPYTAGLMASLPHMGTRGTRLQSVGGRVPSLQSMPSGCRFRSRCSHAIAGCELPPPMRSLGDASIRCLRAGELVMPGAVPAATAAAVPGDSLPLP